MMTTNHQIIIASVTDPMLGGKYVGLIIDGELSFVEGTGPGQNALAKTASKLGDVFGCEVKFCMIDEVSVSWTWDDIIEGLLK